jgi:hypothetical protein
MSGLVKCNSSLYSERIRIKRGREEKTASFVMACYVWSREGRHLPSRSSITHHSCYGPGPAGPKRGGPRVPCCRESESESPSDGARPGGWRPASLSDSGRPSGPTHAATGSSPLGRPGRALYATGRGRGAACALAQDRRGRCAVRGRWVPARARIAGPSGNPARIAPRVAQTARFRIVETRPCGVMPSGATGSPPGAAQTRNRGKCGQLESNRANRLVRLRQVQKFHLQHASAVRRGFTRRAPPSTAALQRGTSPG